MATRLVRTSEPSFVLLTQHLDGLDETILPADYTASGQILDDDLYRILVLALPRGCRLTGIMDCCHSGTGMDLYGYISPCLFSFTALKPDCVRRQLCS